MDKKEVHNRFITLFYLSSRLSHNKCLVAQSQFKLTTFPFPEVRQFMQWFGSLNIYLTWFSFSFGALVFFFKAAIFSHYSYNQIGKLLLLCRSSFEINLRVLDVWKYFPWQLKIRIEVSYNSQNIKTGFTLRGFSENFC